MTTKNGFIFPLFDAFIRFLCYCNLVEYFKNLAKLYLGVVIKRNRNEVTDEELVKVSNIAIDIYQVFKWATLFSLWVCESNSTFSKIVIYYLITSNIFTYFYYHVWGSPYQQSIDRESLNRRFLNALLAISYYIFCYAYLYEVHYANSITWPEGGVDSTNAIYLSVANAFTLTYGGFRPTTQGIRVIFMSELVNTFLFFTVIISNSIPNHTERGG